MRCPKCGMVVFSELDLDPEFHTEEECENFKKNKEEERE